MKRLLFGLLVLLLMQPLPAQTRKTSVSVMDINHFSGLSDKEIALLTDKLVNSLVEYRIFEVVERSQRDEILKEQGFQMSGACDEMSCLVQVGQLLGAQKMIGGSIGKIGSTLAVELRMIDIQTGQIDLSFSRNLDSEKKGDLLGLMREAAEIFSSWKPSKTGETAKPGGLFISSEPVGARILIDGSERPETTPAFIFPLNEGLHQIVLIKVGYRMYSASRLVSLGNIDTLSVPLLSLAGKLKIKTEPSATTLYLNEKYAGTTSEQPFTIEDLSDTSYVLKTVKFGYRTRIFNLKIEPSKENKVDIKLTLKRFSLTPSFYYYNPFTADNSNFDTPLYITQTISSSGNPMIEFIGKSPVFDMSLGLNVSRNISLSFNYQMKNFKNVLDGYYQDSYGINTPFIGTQLDVDIFTQSALLGFAASLPLGKRVESFAEGRVGLSMHAMNQKYEYQFNTSFSDSAGYHVVRDSNKTVEHVRNIENICWQAGGGFKFWLSPGAALKISALYNYDKANKMHIYAIEKDSGNNNIEVIKGEVEEIDLTGLMIGFGFMLYF